MKVKKTKKTKREVLVPAERIVEIPNFDTNLIHSWYRLGAFTPFFRAHAHIKSHRREPYCFNNELQDLVRETLQLRYKMLVYIYTQFFMASNMEYGGCKPIMRPLWYQDPAGRHESTNESSYFFGDAIVVSPLSQRNDIGKISTKYEFNDHGQIVFSQHQLKTPEVRVQIV